MNKRLWMVLSVLTVAVLLLMGCGTGIQAYGTEIEQPEPGEVQEIKLDRSLFYEGNVVTFGRYEQDNNEGNGPEPIEWDVVYISDDTAMLMSRYILDAREYGYNEDAGSWETSNMRAWLNNDFFNIAFNIQEQSAIRITALENNGFENYGYHMTEGQDTDDKVYLLSFADAGYTYSNDEARMRTGTDYALAKGLYAGDGLQVNGRPTSPWWLRSPEAEEDVAFVSVGVIDSGGHIACLTSSLQNVGVCPCICVNLNADFFQ